MAACTDDERIGGGASSGSEEQCVSAVMTPSGALPQPAQPPTENVATAGLHGEETLQDPKAGELAWRGPWQSTASKEIRLWQASMHCAQSSMSLVLLRTRPFLDHQASESLACAFSSQGMGPKT